MQLLPCPDCNGARLKKESLHYKIGDKNIADLAQMEITALGHWFNNEVDKLFDKNKPLLLPKF